MKLDEMYQVPKFDHIAPRKDFYPDPEMPGLFYTGMIRQCVCHIKKPTLTGWCISLDKCQFAVCSSECVEEMVDWAVSQGYL